MQGPLPPPPFACPPDPAAEVQGVDESAAPWFPGHPGREACEVYHIADELSDGAARALHDRDDLRMQLEDATARLGEEERIPVIDERKQRRPPRAERHR